MNITELKKRYDTRTIDEIEGDASQSSKTHQEAHKEFISVLFYLEHTKRFRENAAYKRASFADYIDKVFGISVQTYNMHRMAYFQFPAEVKSIGVRAVFNTIKKCGAAMVPTVAKEINKEKSPSKDRSGEIIDKFAKAHLKKRKARPSYKDLERDNAEKDKRLAEAYRKIKEQTQQIDKLKATVENYKKIFGEVQQAFREPIFPQSGIEA